MTTDLATLVGACNSACLLFLGWHQWHTNRSEQSVAKVVHLEDRAASIQEELSQIVMKVEKMNSRVIRLEMTEAPQQLVKEIDVRLTRIEALRDIYFPQLLERLDRLAEKVEALTSRFDRSGLNNRMNTERG